MENFKTSSNKILGYATERCHVISTTLFILWYCKIIRYYSIPLSYTLFIVHLKLIKRWKLVSVVPYIIIYMFYSLWLWPTIYSIFLYNNKHILYSSPERCAVSLNITRHQRDLKHLYSVYYMFVMNKMHSFYCKINKITKRALVFGLLMFK